MAVELSSMALDQGSFPCPPCAVTWRDLDTELDPDDQDAAAFLITACAEAGGWTVFLLKELLDRIDFSERIPRTLAFSRLERREYLRMPRAEGDYLVTPLPKIAGLMKRV